MRGCTDPRFPRQQDVWREGHHCVAFEHSTLPLWREPEKDHRETLAQPLQWINTWLRLWAGPSFWLVLPLAQPRLRDRHPAAKYPSLPLLEPFLAMTSPAPQPTTPPGLPVTASRPSANQTTATDKTYALLYPDGRLEWRSSSDKAEVCTLVGGHRGPFTVVTQWLGPARSLATSVLKLMASDLCLTEHYEPNRFAQQLITRISYGHVPQRWGGVVALVEYGRDPIFGEVLFPRPMSPEWVREIDEFYKSLQP